MSDDLFVTFAIKYRTGTSSLSLLDDSATSVPMGLLLPRQSPFLSVFNKNIRLMASSGILDMVCEEVRGARLSRQVLARAQENIGPQVLTMDHLMVGFQLCSAFLIIATITFLCEIIYFWSKISLMLLIENSLLLSVVRAFLRSQK